MNSTSDAAAGGTERPARDSAGRSDPGRSAPSTGSRLDGRRAERAGGMGTRWLLILIAVAFIGGAILTGWLVTRYDLFGRKPTALRAPSSQSSAPPEEGLTNSAAPDAQSSSAPDVPRIPDVALTSARVENLEDRLARLRVAADAASDNASRAERLLTAFAVRRRVERAEPLGYLADQLQRLFGAERPTATSIILDASTDPVTLEQLQGGLSEIGDQLTVGDGTSNLWQGIRRELGELFVLRREGTPSPAPTQRFARAQRFLASGNVGAAVEEVQRLPGRDAAANWLAAARRYMQIQRALDVIEAAAILTPRDVAAATGAGGNAAAAAVPRDLPPDQAPPPAAPVQGAPASTPGP